MEEVGRFIISAPRYMPEDGCDVLKTAYLVDSARFKWSADINHAKVWTRCSDVVRYLRALPIKTVDNHFKYSKIVQLSLETNGSFILIDKINKLDEDFIKKLERFRGYTRKRKLFLDAQNKIYVEFRKTHKTFHGKSKTVNEFKEFAGCSFCGNFTNLEFHHIRRHARRKSSITLVGSWEELEKKLQLGLVLCKPCHKDLHDRFRYKSTENDDESGDIL